MLKRILFLCAFTFVVSGFVFAQITTSSLTGSVKGPGDDPLVGATITATHVPSGTKYNTSTRGGGTFLIANMRPGGPYTIEVSFVGYVTEKIEDVFFQLAESFVLTPVLKKTDGVLENVVLTTGRRSQTFNPNRTGAVTNVGTRQITQAPAINRNILDLTRMSPQANGQAIGGGNTRQNNFTVDGAEFNNSFGIQIGGAGNLPGGGSPISFDALEEVSISINPYDVRQSGFVGSAINAVTRSGTNTFTASVYKYSRNEKLRGDQVEKVKFVRPVEQFDQFGVRFGGPLIKNKLFFFLSYENDKQPKTIQTRVASTTAAPYGSSPNIARPTADSLNYISQYLLDNYGYTTGPYDNYTPNIERTKILARLDWNINSKNRLVLRYNQVEGGEPSSISNSVTGTGLTNPAGLSRTDNNALWFKNSNYFQGANFYSFATELNSQIGKVANTFRGTYTFLDDSRETDSEIFPLVDIMSTSGVSQSAVYTSFGFEPFSFGNLRQVKTYSFVDELKWKTNKHSWTIGGQFEQSQIINGFQRFATSYYRFATWADFASALNPNPALRAKPTDFALTYSLSKDFAPAFSSFKFRQYSVYGQDEIALSKKFRLTVGLRLDLPTYPGVDQIRTHPLVLAMNFANGEKVNTGNLPGRKIMWSPRMGFNWDIYGDRSLQIRGGTGVFTGKIPFVWIVSQSGDNGMIQITQAFNGQANTPGPFDPNPFAYRPAVVPAAGTIVPQSVTALDDDFKNPQTWKSSLALDTKLPWGLVATIEGIFNKDLNTVFFRSPNYQTPLPLNTAGYPDNRPIYGSTVQTRFINTLNNAGVPTPGGSVGFTPVIIDNGSRGYYASLSFKVEKPFSKGLTALIAYTKSIAGNLHDGTGDQPLGSYQGTQQVNSLNTPSLDYAQYVVPDRVIAALSYRKEYFKHLGTTISLFYEGAIDARYSYVYGADFNRDGVNGNDLIYIPTVDQVAQMTFVTHVTNGVSYDGPTQRVLFENYIQQDKYLRKHRGQYAERNGAQLPWRNQVDVKFLQDLFIKAGKNRHTVQFSVDILNAGNLLNPSWGKRKQVNASSILIPQNQNSLVPGGAVIPTFKLAVDRNNMITRTFRDNVSVASTYQIQFGFRYIFN